MKEGQSDLLQRLDNALDLFQKEMKDAGLWDQVTVAATSDFGRTLTPNGGEGSDHGWGGNYFMMGGSVKGGQILGEYPSDLTSTGDLNIGRGRLIPTLSWESMLMSAVQWLGLDTEEELDYVLPNRYQSETRLYTMNEVFETKSNLRGTE